MECVQFIGQSMLGLIPKGMEIIPLKSLESLGLYGLMLSHVGAASSE